MKTRLNDIWRFLKSSSVYSPKMNPPIKYILKDKKDLIGRIDTIFNPSKIIDKYNLYITERIIEIPFIHRVLDLEPESKILEFGSANSKLSIELASRGMKVTGVDLRPNYISHPNLLFYQGNYFNIEFSDSYFDAIIAVSAVEHAGLGAYGEKIVEDADKYLLQSFFRQLKQGGQLIITVPFGKSKITPKYRIYDHNTLKGLLEGYLIDIEEYYLRHNYSEWLPSNMMELESFDWEPIQIGAEGVVCIAAQRL